MTTTTIIARCCALASLLCVCAPAVEAHPLANQSQDSVAYQINQDHSGSMAFTGGFSGTLTQLWSVNLYGNLSYPLTANGNAYVTIGANGGTLLAAIDLSTGTTSWEKLLPGASSWADAAYDAGNVFVANGSGVLLAFRDTGKPLWSVQLSSSDPGAPAARNGMVVLQYNSSEYYQQNVSAYDEATGTSLWTVNPGYNDSSTGISGVPLLTKSGVYLSSSEDFYGLSSSDGSTIWSATLFNQPYDTPVRSRTRLFVSETQECCYGSNTIFDLANGAVKGTFAGSSAPVLLGKTLIVSLDGVLYDYSPGSGNVHWSFPSDGNSFIAKPIVINGYVAVLSENGNLYLLDGSTGEQLWTTTLSYNYCCGGQGPDAGLGAGEGVLLVPYGGTLFAFAPQQGSKLGSRPEPTRVIGRLINGRFVPSQAR